MRLSHFHTIRDGTIEDAVGRTDVCPIRDRGLLNVLKAIIVEAGAGEPHNSACLDCCPPEVVPRGNRTIVELIDDEPRSVSLQLEAIQLRRERAVHAMSGQRCSENQHRKDWTNQLHMSGLRVAS
jgi:hypothetical protein